MKLVQKAYKTYTEEGSKTLFSKGLSYLGQEVSHYPQYRLYNWYWTQKHGNGTPVMAKDWDNLIVLDACRYDEFKRQNPFDNPVKQRVSLGSNTTEYLNRNFLGKTYYDTVYVSANPKAIKLESGDYGSHEVFHALIPIIENWDPETYTVLPETVTEKSLNIHEQFPDKRLLIHFVQPHVPFIGETARKLREKSGITVGGWEFDHRDYTYLDHSIDIERVSIDAMDDPNYQITSEDIRAMYRESLSITLSHVEGLVEQLDGKTAITADHGEMFGEKAFPGSKQIYSHPKRMRTDELCLVPWIEIEQGERKDIVAEEPVARDNFDDELVEARLEALGYA